MPDRSGSGCSGSGYLVPRVFRSLASSRQGFRFGKTRGVESSKRQESDCNVGGAHVQTWRDQTVIPSLCLFGCPAAVVDAHYRFGCQQYPSLLAKARLIDKHCDRTTTATLTASPYRTSNQPPRLPVCRFRPFPLDQNRTDTCHSPTEKNGTNRRQDGRPALENDGQDLRIQGDAAADAGARRGWQDDDPVQAQARAGRHHDPDGGLQRRGRDVQERAVQRLGRGRPGQDPAALEALLQR